MGHGECCVQNQGSSPEGNWLLVARWLRLALVQGSSNAFNCSCCCGTKPDPSLAAPNTVPALEAAGLCRPSGHILQMCDGIETAIRMTHLYIDM